MKPWVRIVIVTFNSGSFTQACIDALAVQTDGRFEAVIVDNMSDDGAVDQLRLPDERFRLIRNTANTGFSGGSNTGLKDALTPYVMTVNPDTTLDPTCLERLYEAAKLFPDAEMISPLLWRAPSDRPGPRIADGIGDSLSAFGIAWRNGNGRLVDPAELPRYSEAFSPSGAAALYRRDAFETAGGFDEGFFCYIEDVDLGLRMRAVGGRCILASDAVAIHSGGHSTSALPGFAIRQTSRNMLLMIVASAPILLLPFMLLQHLIAHAWFQYRNRGTDVAHFRRVGFKNGWRKIRAVLKIRRQRPAYKIGAGWRVARRLSWSIRDVNQRRVRLWPLSDGEASRINKASILEA